METGDLCADTAPTTKSKTCHDPEAVNDTCGFTIYHNTPYSNYMSYTGRWKEQMRITKSALYVNNMWVMHFCATFPAVQSNF